MAWAQPYRGPQRNRGLMIWVRLFIGALALCAGIYILRCFGCEDHEPEDYQQFKK